MFDGGAFVCINTVIIDKYFWPARTIEYVEKKMVISVNCFFLLFNLLLLYVYDGERL